MRSRRPNRRNLFNIFSSFFNDFLFQEQLRGYYYWISDSSKEYPSSGDESLGDKETDDDEDGEDSLDDDFFV